MKQSIHPTWNDNAKVTCACGNTFTTGSTLPEIRVDICSACHPFYTGTQKLVDTLGQVERFQKRTADAAVKKEQVMQIQTARAARVSTQKTDKLSLKDLLMQARKSSAN